MKNKNNKKESKKRAGVKNVQSQRNEVDLESNTKKSGVHSDSAPIGGG